MGDAQIPNIRDNLACFSEREAGMELQAISRFRKWLGGRIVQGLRRQRFHQSARVGAEVAHGMAPSVGPSVWAGTRRFSLRRVSAWIPVSVSAGSLVRRILNRTSERACKG